MAWCILDVAARGIDLRSDEGLTAIARNFRDWYDTRPPDIGNQTRVLLRTAGPSPSGASMTALSEELHARTGHTAGNGSLMRTAAVALPYLSDETAVVEAARAIGALTHWDPHAQEACVLWSLAIRHAILHAEFDIRSGLDHLPEEARVYWVERLDEAENSPPATFNPNGWAVAALQAAWAAIVQTPEPVEGPACVHLQDALATAIGIGNDTDTVAAIAGSLLGARWGASAVPAKWRRILHGYPGITGERLVELASLAVWQGRPGYKDWPAAARLDYSEWQPTGVVVPHPHDEGVLLGDVAVLDDLPEEVTAVVSLCLIGSEQAEDVLQIGFRLIDSDDLAFNPNLEFVLADAAKTIADLRAEGHVVLLHCVAAQSRTPTVAAAYSNLLGVPVDDALAAVRSALPGCRPQPNFVSALHSR